LGKPYSILLSPENDAVLRPEFLRVVAQKERIAYREIDVIRKDGSVANVVFSWSPLLTQGEVKGVVGTVLDMTERKRAEEKVS
jgi:PAS domain S-box-containing protein